MNLTRRELKFQIPLAMVGPISAFVERYCEMDKYSVITPGNYYTINSLYLDNDHMYLLENMRRNLSNRFAVRIRTYGDNPVFPGFIEIKAKVDQMINKQRAPVTSFDTIDFIRHGHSRQDNPDLRNPVLNRACYHALTLGLKPKIMTQYKRKAYFGLHDVYSRVTFDRHMRCYQESDWEIFPREERFRNYDHEEQYVSPDANVVLELKCELKIPSWMLELVRRFELRQGSFSKYDSSWSFLTDQDRPELFA